MGLTKQTKSNIVFLEVKYYGLWCALKKHVDGCDIEEPTNPATGQKVLKYGYKYRSVTGRATKLIWYDTENKFDKRYFGFKLTILDAGDMFVLDMPYQSQVLRRFLRLAKNIDWDQPFTLTVFKGKKKEGSGSEDTGIWFEQNGETVKAYYSKDNPHDMPIATQDALTHDWDFKPQQRWLAEKLKNETAKDIEAAAARFAPPIEPHSDAAEPEPQPEPFTGEMIDEDDCPF